jgi:hypothetical protein
MQAKANPRNKPLIGFIAYPSNSGHSSHAMPTAKKHTPLSIGSMAKQFEGNSSTDRFSAPESPRRGHEELTTTERGSPMSAEWLTALAIGQCDNVSDIAPGRVPDTASRRIDSDHRDLFNSLCQGLSISNDP